MQVDLDSSFPVRVIDALRKRYPSIQKINLFFAGGGEPLLKIDTIKSVVRHVAANGLTPEVRVVTNGLLVPDHIAWLRDNRVFLRVSYDGSAQSVQRPGRAVDSEVAAKRALGCLRDSYPSNLLAIQMTATTRNVEAIPEDVVSLIRTYGFKIFKIEPVQVSYSKRSRNAVRPSPTVLSESILSLMDRLVREGQTAFLDLSYLSVPSTSYFCSLRNKIIVSPHGIIVPCVELIGHGIREDLVLARDQGSEAFDFDAIEARQRQFLDRYHPQHSSQCAACDLVHICKGNCPMRQIVSGEEGKPFDYNCRVAKLLIPGFLSRAANDDAYMRLAFADSFSKQNA